MAGQLGQARTHRATGHIRFRDSHWGVWADRLNWHARGGWFTGTAWSPVDCDRPSRPYWRRIDGCRTHRPYRLYRPCRNDWIRRNHGKHRPVGHIWPYWIHRIDREYRTFWAYGCCKHGAVRSYRGSFHGDWTFRRCIVCDWSYRCRRSERFKRRDRLYRGHRSMEHWAYRMYWSDGGSWRRRPRW